MPDKAGGEKAVKTAHLRPMAWQRLDVSILRSKVRRDRMIVFLKWVSRESGVCQQKLIDDSYTFFGLH